MLKRPVGGDRGTALIGRGHEPEQQLGAGVIEPGNQFHQLEQVGAQQGVMILPTVLSARPR